MTVSAEERDATLIFRVHNPGVMSAEVQGQIFHRAFSTKGEEGRGIGTYSIRLFTEQYLQGHVRFTSNEPAAPPSPSPSLKTRGK